MRDLHRVLFLLALLLGSLAPALRGEVIANAPAAGATIAPATQPAPPEPKAWTGPFFFIQMSDAHIGWPGDFGVTGFERAIRDANRLKPAFVVVTGDLIDTAGDRTMIAHFKEIAAKLDKSIPLYLIPGNHDLHDTPTPQSLALYRQEFGRDYYSIDIHGCHLVLFDSEIANRPQATGDEADRQLAWLSADMAKAAAAKPTHIFTFSHHPIFVAQPDEPDAHGNLPLAVRSIYLGLLTKYNVTAAISGHQHFNSRAMYGHVEMITSCSLCKPSPLGHAGFRVFKVYRDHIEHHFYSLDHPPDEVTLTSAPARSASPSVMEPAGAAK